MTCSPRSKNPPTVTCWTGKKSSISRSTRSATSSSKSSQTSRPGESCTPTIGAPWTPSPKPSQLSSHYTSTNWPVNKPPCPSTTIQPRGESQHPNGSVLTGTTSHQPSTLLAHRQEHGLNLGLTLGPGTVSAHPPAAEGHHPAASPDRAGAHPLGMVQTEDWIPRYAGTEGG